MRAIGIDPSLVGTGFCAHDLSGLDSHTELIATWVKDGSVIQRALMIARRIQMLLNTEDVVFMEDYAYGVKPSASSLTQLGELGGLIKAVVFAATKREPVLVTTSQMRKFLSGDGKLKREMIPVEVLKVFGSVPASHDECVAKVIAWMGACILEGSVQTKLRAKILADVVKRSEVDVQALAKRSV